MKWKHTKLAKQLTQLQHQNLQKILQELNTEKSMAELLAEPIKLPEYKIKLVNELKEKSKADYATAELALKSNSLEHQIPDLKINFRKDYENEKSKIIEMNRYLPAEQEEAHGTNELHKDLDQQQAAKAEETTKDYEEIDFQPNKKLKRRIARAKKLTKEQTFYFSKMTKSNKNTFVCAILKPHIARNLDVNESFIHALKELEIDQPRNQYREWQVKIDDTNTHFVRTIRFVPNEAAQGNFNENAHGLGYQIENIKTFPVQFFYTINLNQTRIIDSYKRAKKMRENLQLQHFDISAEELQETAFAISKAQFRRIDVHRTHLSEINSMFCQFAKHHRMHKIIPEQGKKLVKLNKEMLEHYHAIIKPEQIKNELQSTLKAFKKYIIVLPKIDLEQPKYKEFKPILV